MAWRPACQADRGPACRGRAAGCAVG